MWDGLDSEGGPVLYSGRVWCLSMARGVERPRRHPRPLAFSPRCHGARAGSNRLPAFTGGPEKKRGPGRISPAPEVVIS
jgi:hypothetical protein